MKNLFDDFLRELNERQAAAQGRPTKPSSGGTDPADDDGPEAPDADTRSAGAEADIPDADVPDAHVEAADGGDGAEADADAAPVDTDAAAVDTDADTGADAAPDDEPIMIRRSIAGRAAGEARAEEGSRRARAGRPGRRRLVPPAPRSLGPQVLLTIVGLVLFAAVFLVGVGLDL